MHFSHIAYTLVKFNSSALIFSARIMALSFQTILKLPKCLNSYELVLDRLLNLNVASEFGR